MHSLAPGAYLGLREATRRVGALALCRTSYVAGQRIPLHAHGEPYLCLALEGSFRERSGHAEYEVAPGGVVFHPRGEAHSDRFGARSSACLNVALGVPWAARLDELRLGAGPALRAPSGPVDALVWRLVEEFHTADDASELAIEGIVLELLATLERGADRREERTPPAWMSAVVARLASELRGPLSLFELAREAGVHPSTLARGFRRFQGCSIGAYRRRARIARACEALRASTLPLAEIAARCGFADQSHLTRSVRKAVGLSPAAYRRARR